MMNDEGLFNVEDCQSLGCLLLEVGLRIHQLYV